MFGFTGCPTRGSLFRCVQVNVQKAALFTRTSYSIKTARHTKFEKTAFSYVGFVKKGTQKQATYIRNSLKSLIS